MCHPAPADWYIEKVYKAAGSLIHCLLVTWILFLDSNFSRHLCINDPKHSSDQILDNFLSSKGFEQGICAAFYHLRNKYFIPRD